MVRNKLLSLHDERIASLLADEDDVDDAARGVDIEQHAVFPE
jgi:hypothetical protein